MFFTLALLFFVFWSFVAAMHIYYKEKIHPVDYLLAIIGWGIAVLPGTFRISFGA